MANRKKRRGKKVAQKGGKKSRPKKRREKSRPPKKGRHKKAVKKDFSLKVASCATSEYFPYNIDRYYSIGDLVKEVYFKLIYIGFFLSFSMYDYRYRFQKGVKKNRIVRNFRLLVTKVTKKYIPNIGNPIT